ncbi:MAG: segregation/condensation protein A [Anaerolineae bacterium]|nr:segregation/condensation protein A [Anaerolineae bacterium]
MVLEIPAITDPQADGYRVRLSVFEGPVELLLRLIEERELSITAVSLAAVADQYLGHIRSFEQRDAAELAAFIEIAARLLLIKSRALLPAASPDVAKEEEDLSADLVRRLEEYRRFRWAAQWLTERREAGMFLYTREPGLSDGRRVPVLRPCPPARLLAALRRVLAGADEAAGDADELVSPLAVTLPQKLRQVLRLLWRRKAVTFSELIHRACCRSEVVVTFLAVLELVRRRRAHVTQQALFGTISISRPPRPVVADRQVESTEQMC